ncbi:MAG: hypothetical protein AAGB07_07070 [Pseudomonadota bacterium]
MALITDAAETWSAPIVLSANEIWQVRQGSVYITTSTSPAADDGLQLHEMHGVQFSVGQVVRYRKADIAEALIVRETV